MKFIDNLMYLHHHLVHMTTNRMERQHLVRRQQLFIVCMAASRRIAATNKWWSLHKLKVSVFTNGCEL